MNVVSHIIAYHISFRSVGYFLAFMQPFSQFDHNLIFGRKVANCDRVRSHVWSAIGVIAQSMECHRHTIYTLEKQRIIEQKCHIR
jgi:hypothetical protein